MKLSLSEREKNLLIILAVVIGVALLYYFFFDNAIQKWSDQKTLYNETVRIQKDMEQYTERGPEIEKNIKELEIKAEGLSKNYYHDYTAHMAEQKITEYANLNNLDIGEVGVSLETKELISGFPYSQESSKSVSALRIPVDLSTSGSYNQILDFLDTVFKDKGIRVVGFSIEGEQGQHSSLSIQMELIVGIKGVL